MSGTLHAYDPQCLHAASSDAIDLVIEARPSDLGGFSVRRLLPAMARRLVGPFIFFDHMGPAHLPVGEGFDVRPHPHIALATVTYLFEGEIVHRDSLGSSQTVRPGDVGWMTAGRGIVHSERSSPEARRAGVRLHGIQSWVALPLDQEEAEPSFHHHAAASIPTAEREGAVLDVMVGEAYGVCSPVAVASPTFYVHARLEADAALDVEAVHEERAVYVAEGSIVIQGRAVGAGSMVVLRSGAPVGLRATQPTRALLLGGAKLEGERHVWWNFVSSSKERIDRAKDDWANGRFPKVPGDEDEAIPLPDG